jgi:hypothetical protein
VPDSGAEILKEGKSGKMKTLALSLLALVIACCLSPPAAAQPLVFELSCPAGYSPLTNMGKTFNQSTGQWRANFCISTSGNGRLLCQADGCQVPTYPLLAPNGTAAAPSYAFTNSPSSGMYRAGAGLLDFAVNGFPVLELNTGGINTVNGNGAPTGFSFIDGANGDFVWDGTKFNMGVGGDDTGTLFLSTLNADTVQGGTAVIGGRFQTLANCSSSASPAVCGTAAAGRVVVAAAATTKQVNTTAVTANSEIIVLFDESLTGLGTCNTGTSEGATYFVSARSGGASFTIKTNTAPVTNPACLSFIIVN